MSTPRKRVAASQKLRMPKEKADLLRKLADSEEQNHCLRDQVERLRSENTELREIQRKALELERQLLGKQASAQEQANKLKHGLRVVRDVIGLLIDDRHSGLNLALLVAGGGALIASLLQATGHLLS